ADNGRLKLDGNLDIAFMNTGTRPIIVLTTFLMIADLPDGRNESTPPCASTFAGLPFEVDSFVVKEKETVSKLLKLSSDPRRLRGSTVESTEDDGIVIPAPKNSRGEPSRSIVACVRLVGATPSRDLLYADVRLADFEWSAQGPEATGYPTYSF